MNMYVYLAICGDFDCRGILPAFGHDRVASESEILGALALARPGQRMHITHLFNVSSFHHRYIMY